MEQSYPVSAHGMISFIQKTAMRQRRTMKEIGEAVLEGSLTPDN